MLFEQLQNNPRESAFSSDSWIRNIAVSAIAHEPQLADKALFEQLLNGDDILLALYSSIGIKKLFPISLQTKAVINDIFNETAELLIRRVSSGPAQLRTAALQALIFDSGHLGFTNVSHILESMETVSGNESVYAGTSSYNMLRIQRTQTFFLTEAFGALMVALPDSSDRVGLIRRELGLSDISRVLAALVSLQFFPIEELTNSVLQLARSENTKIAQEAVKALLACGGSKVYLVILSLLKETMNKYRLAVLLPLAAATGRDEVWPFIKQYALSDSGILAESAIKAAESFPLKIEDRAELYKKAMKSSDPAISCLAAVYAYKIGSMKSGKILEKNLESNVKKNRLYAARYIGFFDVEFAIPRLIKCFENERNGDVLREITLSLRNLSQVASNNVYARDCMLPWLARQLKSTDPFKRTQSAVLCGFIGKSSEEMLLSSIYTEEHPYVVSAALTALGKIGFDKDIVYSKYFCNKDPRIRAAALESMSLSGNSALYYTKALNDVNPRVKTTAIYKLFLMGQTDVVNDANKMLSVPEPASVLSSCYALSKMMRIQPSLLNENDPLSLTIASKTKCRIRSQEYGPIFLSNQEMAMVFNDMSMAGGNRKRLMWLLEEYYRKSPELYAVRRMLASFLAINGDYERSLELIDLCLNENPSSLADLLDSYRISVRLCELKKAADYGEKLKKLYKTLLFACKHVCVTISGKNIDKITKRLDDLTEPSMNLYNVMVQLKVYEKDLLAAQDLLVEIILSRPFNKMAILKLANMLPQSFVTLKIALEAYASSLPVTAIGI